VKGRRAANERRLDSLKLFSGVRSPSAQRRETPPNAAAPILQSAGGTSTCLESLLPLPTQL
jgi:hypothetical protein